MIGVGCLLMLMWKCSRPFMFCERNRVTAERAAAWRGGGQRSRVRDHGETTWNGLILEGFTFVINVINFVTYIFYGFESV